MKDGEVFSLRSLLALFPETLVQIRVPQVLGDKLTSVIPEPREVAALAAALRLGGWRMGDGYAVAGHQTCTWGALPVRRITRKDGSRDWPPESIMDFF